MYTEEIYGSPLYGLAYMSPFIAGSTIIIGGVIWSNGAKGIQLWEAKKIDLAMKIRGPDLARGERTGGISLVLSY